MNALLLAAQWVAVPKKKEKGKHNQAHVCMKKKMLLLTNACSHSFRAKLLFSFLKGNKFKASAFNASQV